MNHFKKNLSLNYDRNHKIGDLVIVDPTMEYDIDWIVGKILPGDKAYYFERYEICLLINVIDYIYVLTKNCSLVKTNHRGAFLSCI